MSKIVSLTKAAALVRDGDRIAIGGNTLHRAPCALLHELVRQGRRNLTLVKTAGSYDLDLLCATGSARAVEAGYVGYENVLGLARGYRRSVESGQVEAHEHSCYTVIAALRAAAQGVPFMPIASLEGSDLIAARGFQRIANPYGEGVVVTIPALSPDVALIHVHEADTEGDGAIFGARFEDALMASAARKVILTCERIVDEQLLAERPDRATIPRFEVDAVVELPHGAWPLACPGEYSYDLDFLTAFAAIASDADAVAGFLAERLRW